MNQKSKTHFSHFLFLVAQTEELKRRVSFGFHFSSDRTEMVEQSTAVEPASRRRTSGRMARTLKTKNRAEKELLVRRRVGLLDDKEDDQPLKKLKLDIVEKSDEAKIKDTLRRFNKHYLHFVQVLF